MSDETLDKRVNKWFGLDEDWKSRSEISSSFFETLRKKDKEIKRLCNKRDNSGSYSMFQVHQKEINRKRKLYTEILKQGPEFKK